MLVIHSKKSWECHNPCFNRITFAIIRLLKDQLGEKGHNPCFNRITFAIILVDFLKEAEAKVTILVLIE